jgi:N-acetylglucosaminyldiphosphoundecaprenol N-acetyl-beta-D-mannosaminyltransferase
MGTARTGVAEKAAGLFLMLQLSLRIVGIHYGIFDHTSGSPENEAVIQEINAANPDVLVVGFEIPLQEGG